MGMGGKKAARKMLVKLTTVRGPWAQPTKEDPLKCSPFLQEIKGWLYIQQLSNFITLTSSHIIFLHYKTLNMIILSINCRRYLLLFS
jgi:hypothetical protein